LFLFNFIKATIALTSSSWDIQNQLTIEFSLVITISQCVSRGKHIALLLELTTTAILVSNFDR